MFMTSHCDGRLLRALEAPSRRCRRLPEKSKGRDSAPAKAKFFLHICSIRRLLGTLGTPPRGSIGFTGNPKGRLAAPADARPPHDIHRIGMLAARS